MVFKKGNVPWNKGRKGDIPWNKGKHLTKEIRAKMSEAHSGEKHHLYGKHHTEETKKKISKAHKGKSLTEEHKQKIGLAGIGRPGYWKGKHRSEDFRKKMSELRLGEKNHFYGKQHTEASKQKMRLSTIGQIVTKETRKKLSLIHKGQISCMKGKHLTEEVKRKMSLSSIDWDFYNEHGCTKTLYPYSMIFDYEFKNMIRKRDGNACVVTGMTNEEHKAKYGRSLHVHHWTYDKDVTDPFYFVTVTCGINIAAETNRGEWIDMFNGIMEDKYCEMMRCNQKQELLF